MSALDIRPLQHPLSEQLASGWPGVSLFWLGQAGFALRAGDRLILIDPYLSDSLAEKYRGKPFSHERMMPPPVTAARLGAVDMVLVTHHHTDHMDAGTLAPLARASRHCRFVVPRAALAEAERRIAVDPERLIGVDAGETLEPLPGLRVTAVRAAHETLERSPEGWHRFLGYVVETGGVRIYHSGDTVPFDGLSAEVAALRPGVALLPVNGRRKELSEAGVAGNLTLDEAVALADEIGATDLIAHHYGMFAFNTLAPEAIDAAAAASAGCGLRIHRARTGVEYRLTD